MKSVRIYLSRPILISVKIKAWIDTRIGVQMAPSFFITDPINYQRDSPIVRSLSDRLKGERSHSRLLIAYNLYACSVD